MFRSDDIDVFFKFLFNLEVNALQKIKEHARQNRSSAFLQLRILHSLRHPDAVSPRPNIYHFSYYHRSTQEHRSSPVFGHFAYFKNIFSNEQLLAET